MGTCGKLFLFLGAVWLFWFCRLLYGISPYFWIHGDMTRSLREWRFWFSWSIWAMDYRQNLVALQDYYIYPENFPDFSKDTPIEVIYVSNENVTADIIRHTWWEGNGILIWRNATRGAHEKMQELDWVRENFDMDQWYETTGDEENYFYYNDTNWNTSLEYTIWGPKPVEMRDFVENTLDGEHKARYIGFNFKIVQENPKVRKAFLDVMDAAIEPIAGPRYFTDKMDKDMAKDMKYLLEFFFIYHGTGMYATHHNGIGDDTFLQIANTKRWIFTHPRYIPYMHQSYKTFGGSIFLDFDEIPKVWVDVGPGDFMYFPPSYVHTVINLEEKWGMGLGIRDVKKTMTMMAQNVLLGSPVEGNVGVFYNQWFQVLKAKIMSAMPNTDRRSALDNASPRFVMDDWQIKHWHKHVANCHNQFEHLINPEIKSGVEIGRGTSHPEGMVDPKTGHRLVSVLPTEEAWEMYENNLQRKLLDAEKMKEKFGTTKKEL